MPPKSRNIWDLRQQRQDVPRLISTKFTECVGSDFVETHTEPMAAAKVARFDEMMRSLLWVNDVVQLSWNRSDSGPTRAYERWFTQVREFIEAYLKRGYPKLAFDRRFADNIDLVLVDIDNPPANCSHYAGSYSRPTRAEIRFYPSFWEDPPSTWSKFPLLRFRAGKGMLHQMDEEDAFTSQQLTLLHEVVHLVSYYTFNGLLATCNLCPGDLPNGVRSASISDVLLSSIATEDDLRKVRPLVIGAEGYGIENCEFLAKLEQGSLGALLNADSYMLFAAQTVFEYLGGVFQDPHRLERDFDVAGLMKIPPDATIVPVTRWWRQPRQPVKPARPTRLLVSSAPAAATAVSQPSVVLIASAPSAPLPSTAPPAKSSAAGVLVLPIILVLLGPSLAWKVFGGLVLFLIFVLSAPSAPEGV